MDNNYIIINKDVLETRIKELEESLKISESSGDNIRAGIETFEIKALKETLLASIPLESIIEEAIKHGLDSFEEFDRNSNYDDESRVEGLKEIQEDYVSQLKLDI